MFLQYCGNDSNKKEIEQEFLKIVPIIQCISLHGYPLLPLHAVMAGRCFTSGPFACHRESYEDPKGTHPASCVWYFMQKPTPPTQTAAALFEQMRGYRGPIVHCPGEQLCSQKGLGWGSDGDEHLSLHLGTGDIRTPCKRQQRSEEPQILYRPSCSLPRRKCQARQSASVLTLRAAKWIFVQ